jgi:ankyrin repeat protein
MTNRIKLHEEFINAVARADISAMASLVRRGANIHYADNDGYTALETAAYYGHTQAACWLLLEGGIDPIDTHSLSRARDIAEYLGYENMASLLQTWIEQHACLTRQNFVQHVLEGRTCGVGPIR